MVSHECLVNTRDIDHPLRLRHPKTPCLAGETIDPRGDKSPWTARLPRKDVKLSQNFQARNKNLKDEICIKIASAIVFRVLIELRRQPVS
jgi:hypothetical protein